MDVGVKSQNFLPPLGLASPPTPFSSWYMPLLHFNGGRLPRRALHNARNARNSDCARSGAVTRSAVWVCDASHTHQNTYSTCPRCCQCCPASPAPTTNHNRLNCELPTPALSSCGAPKWCVQQNREGSAEPSALPVRLLLEITWANSTWFRAFISVYMYRTDIPGGGPETGARGPETGKNEAGRQARPHKRGK
eukprot:1420698-Prymnesium_polylepis.1